MSRGRRAIHAPVAIAIGLLIALSVQPAALSGPAMCTFDSSTGVLTIDLIEGSQLFLARSRRRIHVHRSECADGATVATVDNTDVIRINGTSSDDQVWISLRRGTFAPGLTDEAGNSDEIEIELALGNGTDIMRWQFGSTDDSLVVGSSGGETLLNLNADERQPDADVSISDDVETLSFEAEEGDDTLFARGGAGTGDVLARGVRFFGDQGDDALMGGGGADRLDDTSTTHPDEVDVLRGGAAADVLRTRDTDHVDRSNGGPGNDRCGQDREDVTRNCR